MTSAYLARLNKFHAEPEPQPTAADTFRVIREERRKREEDKARREMERRAEFVRVRCLSLMNFTREAWPVLEPHQPYVHGWHAEAICEHLEAVTRGEITRLLINVPPSMSKSLLVSVLWPSWEWGPMAKSSLRYLTTSWHEKYVKRDSRRMRDLIQSEWYQAHWGDKFRLVRTGEISFANDRTGYREGVSFEGLTSGKGDRVIIDDPHSTEKAESPAERETAIRIFRESLPSRVNDPEKSAIVIVMQRLHEGDVSGVALAQSMGYVHLMLPMEFERDRRCVTEIGFVDPRTREGELLFPQRFPREVVERDKAAMGSHATAGQFQQRPTARAGGMFKRAWFLDKKIKAAPRDTVWVRHWDLAGTKGKKSPRTAGVKLGRMPDNRYVVGHVVLAREEGHEVRKIVKGTAELDGDDVEISIPQDPGQAGKVQAADYVAGLAGYSAHAEPETGDKATRAAPFAAQCEAGNVYYVEGEWNEAYIDELCLFPGGVFKDQVDASSGAFARLVLRPAGESSTSSLRGGW